MVADKSDAPIRQEMVDSRPDPRDTAAWPDIQRLPGRLLPAVEMLRADIDAGRLRGIPVDRLCVLRDAIYEAREALIRLHGLSPLEAWRLLHPPRPDPCDGVYDCGSEDCPDAGFATVEDKVLHYQRWGIPL